MGVVQHHDAVAGTERQAVIDDYSYHLSEAQHIESHQFLDSFRRISGTTLEHLAM